MSKKPSKVRVGEIRPSQLMFTYGVGAIVDLPKISVIVMGLEDWQASGNLYHTQSISENRLLSAVRYRIPTVERLLTPPAAEGEGLAYDPFDSSERIGVPVATFPRWMLCPQCRLLAPLSSGVFQLSQSPVHVDRTVYRHTSCSQARNPEVVPARFLVICEAGHMDDFPWIEFVHHQQPCKGAAQLRLREFGATGEARYLEVSCDTCNATRRLSDAFGRENREKMPMCSGRRPHLRDYDPVECEYRSRPIILGASNMWFPVVLSTVAIPTDDNRLARLVEEQWATVQNVQNLSQLEILRDVHQIRGEITEYLDADIFAAIQNKRDGHAHDIPQEMPDLKAPEWEVFTRSDPALNSDDFRLRKIEFSEWRYSDLIHQIIMVERLREVRAMIGFTRLDATGELTDPDVGIQVTPAPISSKPTTWVPANEVRGEGIFIQFTENSIQKWERQQAVQARDREFFEAHIAWRQARHIKPAKDNFPHMRYVLLHSFAHAFMRQLALESGYAAASLRERIYSRVAGAEGGPMAGVLIYTAATDSEGTLGGLTRLSDAPILQQYILQALESVHLCASDPLCAATQPANDGRSVHGAACHACLLAPETSCERGNKYLDRSTLTKTMEYADICFF